jgi:hypothetical protein
LFFQGSSLSSPGLAIARIDTQAYRSACLLTLALLKWRLEHGQLPPRLDDLDAFSLTFAIDPWSGRMFGYLPDGSGWPLKFANLTPTTRPLLWSAGGSGARVIPLGGTETGRPAYHIALGWPGARLLAGTAQRGIGLGFEIPSAAQAR